MNYLTYRSKLNVVPHGDAQLDSIDVDLPTSDALHSPSVNSKLFGKNFAPGSSKFILSQSKKPSGSTAVKPSSGSGSDDVDEGDIASTAVTKLKVDIDGNGDGDKPLGESVLELRVQVKELRMELERREAESKDLQVDDYYHPYN